ncbi:hypothetical protein, partial [Bradyrhizobium sp. SZCCHNPS1003]|uniref:hypothetical protein n=1 Tax=Bradyrhizobium sp. SZCCHNPS1003 TaxID=3057330 RepID=UPI0028E38A15
ASCSFKIPMICSSVKRLRFMLWSSLEPERTSSWIKPEGQGQVTLVGLIKFLDQKGIPSQDLTIEFLETVAASESAQDEVSPLIADGIE